LNIIPVVEKAKFHGEMFRAWSELRADAVLEGQKTCDSIAKSYHFERLAELIGKMESLHREESSPDVKLLRRCQEDENEMVWGRGIRTNDQVELEREKRLQQAPLSTSAAD